MKKLFAVVMFVSVALTGCQNKQNAQSYIPSPPLEVTTQSVTGPISLPSGAEVSIFSGWKIFKYEDHMEFLSPENDMRVGYYELSAENIILLIMPLMPQYIVISQMPIFYC